MRLQHAACAFSLIGLAMSVSLAHAQGGGLVEVSFPTPDRYLDAGDGPGEQRANFKQLEQHLQSLGKAALAPGQRLQIEVIELDLAGRFVHNLRLAQPYGLRVLDGGADWPRIELRYVLSNAGGELARGEESLSDKVYQVHPISSIGAEPLRYERRMLTQWFNRRFAPRTEARLTP